MKIDSKIWNTLLICSAQRDVRQYLNGIFVDFKNDRLATTNGHRLFVQNNVDFLEFSGEKSNFILGVDNKFKAPADIDEVSIDEELFFSNLRIPINYIKKDEIVLTRYANIVDGKFPDIDRVIPNESLSEPTEVVGINPEYIADVAKALKVKAMKLQTYGGNSFGIEFPPIPDIQYIVMSMRV